MYINTEALRNALQLAESNSLTNMDRAKIPVSNQNTLSDQYNHYYSLIDDIEDLAEQYLSKRAKYPHKKY